MISSLHRHGEYSIVARDYHAGVFSDWRHVVQRHCSHVFWKSLELYPFTIVYATREIKGNDISNLIKKTGICTISLLNNYAILRSYECLWVESMGFRLRALRAGAQLWFQTSERHFSDHMSRVYLTSFSNVLSLCLSDSRWLDGDFQSVSGN